MPGSKIHSFEGNEPQEMEEYLAIPAGIYIVTINNKVTVKIMNKN